MDTQGRKNAWGTGSSQRREWLAVGSIAAGTFLLVTTEFLPIGMLSRLAQDLGVSEGVAGLAVTAPGLIAAFAAPALVLIAGAIDRRTLITLLTTAIVISSVLSALAPNFIFFLIGRLILGLAVGGLWSFAVSVGRRLVAPEAGGRATSIISAGISAGTIFGMPVGAVLASSVGWRVTFAANALMGTFIVLLQLRLLPVLPVETPITFRRLFAFSKVPMARIGLAATGFMAGGHFVAYTFLEPFLREGVHLGQTGVTMALAGYAAVGIVGAVAGERMAACDVRRAMISVSVLQGLSILAAISLKGTIIGAVGMVMVWGLAFGAVPVCVQMWMYNSSPQLYEAGSALMVSSFQISLSAGAAIGAILLDHAGIGATFVVSAVLILLGGVTVLHFDAIPIEGISNISERDTNI